MRDRLGDLEEAKTTEPQPQTDKKKKKEKEVKQEEGGNSEALKGFFEEIEFLRDQVAQIHQSTLQIDKLHQQALNVISEEESNQKANELENMMAKTNKQSSEIRNLIKKMDAVNKTLAKDPKNAGVVRIRISQHGAVTKKFLDVMTEYKEIQRKHQERYKQRMQRQFLIVNPTATPDEIAEVLESKDQKPIFAQQVISGGQKSEAKRALKDIENRHQDILRIERSILELQQLFMDMSVIVAAQGELLNQIDSHVLDAIDTTEAGIGALKTAKMCIIMVCLVILSVAIGVGISMSKK